MFLWLAKTPVEMRNMNLPRGKEWLVRKAEKLIAMSEQSKVYHESTIGRAAYRCFIVLKFVLSIC
jgi:hypothetical protein